MVAQVHALKNKMTTALLTAGAMLDGTVPSDKKNLRELVQALDEANRLLAAVPKYDLEPETKTESVIDVPDMIRTVAGDLALVSSATGVGLTVAADLPESGCQALYGNRRSIYEALESALHALMVMLPTGSVIDLAPRSPAVLALTVSFANGRPENLTEHLAKIAPHLEPHSGTAHRDDASGAYCLHLPGTSFCPAGSNNPACPGGKH